MTIFRSSRKRSLNIFIWNKKSNHSGFITCELLVTSGELEFKKIQLRVTSWVCEMRVTSCSFKITKLWVASYQLEFNKQNSWAANQKCELKIKVQVENKCTRRYPQNLKPDINILCMTPIWFISTFPESHTHWCRHR